MGNVACMEVASISVLSALLQFMAAIKARVHYHASFTYHYDIQWSVLLSVNITALSYMSVAIAEVGTGNCGRLPMVVHKYKYQSN